jgi:hypothetical protein
MIIINGVQQQWATPNFLIRIVIWQNNETETFFKASNMIKKYFSRKNCFLFSFLGDKFFFSFD